MNIMLPLMALSACSTNLITTQNNVYESSTIGQFINLDEVMTSNDAGIEPVVILPGEDQYEPNDNLDAATGICPTDFYLKDSYSIDLDATLDYVTSFNDIDFYYITIFTDSNVTININADSDYDGNFYFLLYDYNYYISGKNAICNQEDIVYYEGVRMVSYANLLKPGTYILCLRGLQSSSTFTNNLPYSLKVDVTKASMMKDVLVSDLTSDEDALGAVWISDFVPCNNYSLFDITSEFTYYKESDSSLTSPNFALNKMSEVSNGETIRLATFYIWNKQLKYVLHELFNETKNYYLDVLQGKYNDIAKFKVQQNNQIKVLEIVATVAGSDLSPWPVQILSGIVSTIGFYAIEKYYEAITPEVNMNDVENLTYITALASYFDLGCDCSSLSEIKKNGSNKVVQVPIYYKLGVNEGLVDRFDEYYYSLKVSSQVCARMSSLIYTSKLFYTDYEDDFYCGGKIYKIKNSNDLYDCSSLELAQEHYHCDDHYCVECETLINSMHNYDRSYVWFSNSQHRVSCKCGAYTTQPHAVKSGSNICILCGKKANIGFVEATAISNQSQYVTDNGSYILKNGVIVLAHNDVEAYLNGTLIFNKKEDDL